MYRQLSLTCAQAAPYKVKPVTGAGAPGGMVPGIPPKCMPGGGSMPMPDCAGSCCAAARPPLPPSKCTVVVPVADCDCDADPDHFISLDILGKGQYVGAGAARGGSARTEFSAPSPVMSNRLDRRLRFVRLDCRMKCFWAWLATWVGVRVVT